MAVGAVGSPHQIGAALNRTTPYLLAGSGVALCFRAGIINIGAEGQIAVGGIGATAGCACLSPRCTVCRRGVAVECGCRRSGVGGLRHCDSTWAGACTKC